MKRMNLLPIAKQRELGYEALFHSVAIAASLGVALLLLGVLVQIAESAYLNRSSVTIDQQIQDLKNATDKTENAELKKKIKLVNIEMGDFQKLSDQSPQWSRVLSAFAGQVPNGVQLTQFTADAKTGKVDIAGISPTRDLVIDLYNNINGDKNDFKDIDYPLENVAKPTDVQFHFTFYIQDGILIPHK